MNDGVGEAVAANVAASAGVVPVPAGLLGDVEPTDERPHRLAPLADLHEHVAVDLRQCVPGHEVRMSEAMRAIQEK